MPVPLRITIVETVADDALDVANAVHAAITATRDGEPLMVVNIGPQSDDDDEPGPEEVN